MGPWRRKEGEGELVRPGLIPLPPHLGRLIQLSPVFLHTSYTSLLRLLMLHLAPANFRCRVCERFPSRIKFCVVGDDKLAGLVPGVRAPADPGAPVLLMKAASPRRADWNAGESGN